MGKKFEEQLEQYSNFCSLYKLKDDELWDKSVEDYRADLKTREALVANLATGRFTTREEHESYIKSKVELCERSLKEMQGFLGAMTKYNNDVLKVYINNKMPQGYYYNFVGALIWQLSNALQPLESEDVMIRVIDFDELYVHVSLLNYNYKVIVNGEESTKGIKVNADNVIPRDSLVYEGETYAEDRLNFVEDELGYYMGSMEEFAKISPLFRKKNREEAENIAFKVAKLLYTKKELIKKIKNASSNDAYMLSRLEDVVEELNKLGINIKIEK